MKQFFYGVLVVIVGVVLGEMIFNAIGMFLSLFGA